MRALLRRQGTTEMLMAMGFIELQASTGLCALHAIQTYSLVIAGGLVD